MTKISRYFLPFCCILCGFQLYSQNKIAHIEPPNWWVGMKNPKVQLLLHGSKIGDFNPSIDYPGVRIERVTKVENPNYLFVDLRIGSEAKAGAVKINFTQAGKPVESHTWQLLQREPGAAERKGFDNSDVLYLITPDRFANGDPKNDEVSGLREKLNRSNPGGRHGGDIEGIRTHLDYISDMGFTAVWLNPVLENDMQSYSYHGYSTTDFYKVDPRFGTNEAYRQLAKEANAKGIKLIMDMIVNHCGSEHWWMKDLPTHDWINNAAAYVETNHKKAVLQDPHVSQADLKRFTDGWFVPTMPDLNQRNELMATYLTQNSIWWVEYLGLAGIRMDTYPYPDMNYMAEWTRSLMEEYPNFNIVGEEWHETPAYVAYWQKGKMNPNGYESDLKSLMDFPLQTAMSKALSGNGSWNEVYNILAQDFLYPNPDDLVVFPDNHDMSRIFAQLREDFAAYQLAHAFVLTTRGTPQLYYGSEFLMTSPAERNDGIIRSDFPGGWAGDPVNGFTGAGLTEKQKTAQDFVRKLLQWRKTATAVHGGKLVHFIPRNGLYVYFRQDDRQRIMVILNKNEAEQTLPLDWFSEMLQGVSNGKNVLDGSVLKMTGEIKVPAKMPLILELN
ncbi:MAG: glycoside hydrolase family 13 protein [Bacteroidota bacterium]